MNGDYGSLRYSKLTQINRENVKNLRMVWAMALGGMQDVGQNGPEDEMNPLIDNGFMYTSDGWGTIYKIDARDPNRGKFAWVADPGVQHEGNASRTRGIALWEDKVLANLPDGRVIAINRENGEIIWDKKIATKNEFGGQERLSAAPLVADGKVLIQNGAGDAGTRGWVAALDVNTGNELWRWYTVPKPGEPGSETWKDDHNAWKTGGGGVWQTGSYDRGAESLHFRHRQSRPHLRPAVPSRRQPLYQLRRRAERGHRQDGVVLPGHAERLVGLRRSRRVHAVRHDDWRTGTQGGGPLRAQWLLLYGGPDQRTVHRRREVRQRSQLDQGHRSGDRQTRRLQPEARRAGLQPGSARAARRSARSARARPGMAASPISRWPTTR